jgi:HNH endonuclease
MPMPVLPFQGYKWRWASFQPTEGLNEPSVFLGVLRALHQFEGSPPSDPGLIQALSIVREQTNTRIDLARTAHRNLIRNSGQYWKGPGLIEEQHGRIELTSFGKKVASGKITKAEYAITVIKTTSLPNPRIFSASEMQPWIRAGLTIKPLELILQVVSGLLNAFGPDEGYLSLKELKSIVIPLAGNSASIDEHVRSIRRFRDGRLDLSSWPNCAPAANDVRMANEYLLFLYHYGFFEKVAGRTREETKYFLMETARQEIGLLSAIPSNERNLVQTAENVRSTELLDAVELSLVERERKYISRLSRSGQARFRREVLRAYHQTCILTGETLEAVLEAPHIIPASKRGPDTIQNGLCMRADIHILFDNGHIRIMPSGDVSYSDAISASITYATLPSRIIIPEFLDARTINWRLRYL